MNHYLKLRKYSKKTLYIHTIFSIIDIKCEESESVSEGDIKHEPLTETEEETPEVRE